MQPDVLKKHLAFFIDGINILSGKEILKRIQFYEA